MRWWRMARYFLHIHNSHGDAEDDEGLHANSLAEAREQAISNIRSLLASEAKNGSMNFRGRVDISDENGKLLLSVPFSDAVSIKGL